MKRLLVTLAVLAMPASVIAQAPNSPATSTPPIAVPPAAPNASPAAVPPAPAYRAGTGTVESIALVHVATAPSSPAAAGGSAAAVPSYRLSMRMDDGTVQSLDQGSRNFLIGDRVEVTNGGQVVRR